MVFIPLFDPTKRNYDATIRNQRTREHPSCVFEQKRSRVNQHWSTKSRIQFSNFDKAVRDQQLKLYTQFPRLT